MAVEVPKGIKSLKKFFPEILKYIYQSRPIEGPGIKINEMPDGRQIVATDSGSGNLEVAMAVWPGPVTKLVKIRSFGERDVTEIIP